MNPTDSIGRQVILSIHHKYDANIRYFVGTLKHMVVQDIVDGWAYYTLIIEPDLQRLSLTSNARVFQQQTVPDIVKKILQIHCYFNLSSCDLNLHNNQRKRERRSFSK
ncbi:MAG: hypothetical protein L3J00_07755 [Thiomicrorhabdus sp.]|nr:hypothetical protein [Thiomicrorhabdus sp.]